MPARAYLGSGDLYLARFVAGVAGAYLGPYQCDEFSIKPNIEIKEKISKGKVTYGQVIESVAVPQPFDLTVALSEVNKESLAIAMFGTVAALTQTAGTLVAVSTLLGALDDWKELSRAALSAVVVTNTPATGSASSIAGTVLTVGGTVTGAFKVGAVLTGAGVTANTTITSLGTGTGGAGTYNVAPTQTVASTTITATSTYIAGTDYLVNADLGWIKSLVGGAITAAETVLISATHAAFVGGTTIFGGRDSNIRVKMRMDGKNFVDGSLTSVTVYEAVIAADSVFDFLSDDFATLNLPGRMKTPSGFLEPFRIDQRTA